MKTFRAFKRLSRGQPRTAGVVTIRDWTERGQGSKKNEEQSKKTRTERNLHE